jgi:hypothetical protein
LNNNGDAVYSWLDTSLNYHGGLYQGGKYYVFDDPAGTNLRADGINDSGAIAGRFFPAGSTSYAGFIGAE